MLPAFSVLPHHALERVVELAQLGERLGYRRCWVYDEGLAARDVYVTMTAIALATETLEVGPGITNPYTRHAGATAGAIAALDEVSGGRAFLGIGAGGSLTLDPLGIERRRPLTAVRETIDACRRLFGAGASDRDYGWRGRQPAAGRVIAPCSAGHRDLAGRARAAHARVGRSRLRRGAS